MKFLLIMMLFSMNSTQCVIYNTPNNQYYVVDIRSNPIQILVIKENIETNPSCIKDNKYSLNKINFSNNATCLMETLNRDFYLNIQHYVDLKDLYSMEELAHLKKAELSDMYKALTKTDHSYSLSELYTIYSQAKKNEFRYEIHSMIYLKIDEVYIPLAYPL
ncbi:MAG: hypothetical protein ACI4U3_04430 [Traorella sp.]